MPGRLNTNQRDKSSVIRQKGESQGGGNKKTKLPKISVKRTFLTPLIHVQGLRNFNFFEKFAYVLNE